MFCMQLPLYAEVQEPKDHVRNSIQFAYILKACSLKNTKVMTVSMCFYESLMSCALNKMKFV